MIGKQFIILLVLLSGGSAFAQSAPSTLPTDPAQVQTLLERTGCSAEVNAASQTIAAQQKQINELQKQLNAKDPPAKSGATKH